MRGALTKFVDSSLGRIVKLASPADAVPPRLQATQAWRDRWSKLSRIAGTPQLPYYHRAGSVALLDDDPLFLEMLEGAVPRSWKARSFLSADSCLNALQQEPPHWESELWAQQELVSQWHRGAPLIPVVLRHWATRVDRPLARVLVADHMMPGKTGLEALGELVDWPGYRVLLTGAFVEELVTTAFNDGLIDRYLAKHDAAFLPRLIHAVESLRASADARMHQIWMGTLSPEQATLISDESVVQDLAPYLHETFREWVILGDPFGILGMEHAGSVVWMQLEPRDHLGELAEISITYGMDHATADRVRAGALLSNVQLRQALSMQGAGVVPARSVGEDGMLLIGRTPVTVTGGVADRNLRWLAAAAHA
jgi:CheY-like chemotaxis protein